MWICWSSVWYAFIWFRLVCFWAFLAAQMFLDMRLIIYCNFEASNYFLYVSESCIYVVSVCLFEKDVVFLKDRDWNWQVFFSVINYSKKHS